MFAKSVFVAAIMAGAAIAQSSSSASAGTRATISTSAIAAEVSGQLKASWCNSQQNVCTKLCSGSVNTNTCDPGALTYTCTCSDGSTPALASYLNTIDYYTCQQAYSDCIVANPNNQLGQDGCVTNIRNNCGTKDIATFTPAATTSSSAPVATSAAASPTSGTGASQTSATAAATSTRASSASGREFGAGIFAAGLAAAVGLAL